MRHHFSPVRMAIINKTINNKHWQGFEKRKPSCTSWILFFFLIFSVLFIYLFYFPTLYWFGPTMTWIRHGCTCAPHPEPLSRLPPHPFPLGLPSAPTPSTLSHASNMDSWFITHMITHMFQCHSPTSSHPRPLPQNPKDCSIHLCLFCCLTCKVIITTFANSIYMHIEYMVKNLPAMQKTQVWCLDWGDIMEKRMATHSSFLAWRISRTEEPGGLQSMGSQRVGHDWESNRHTYVYIQINKHINTCIYTHMCVCLCSLTKSLTKPARNFSGKSTRAGYHLLPQEIPGSIFCISSINRQILYHCTTWYVYTYVHTIYI